MKGVSELSTVEKIVIVGGVAAGPKTAARARRRSPNADITIIERGRRISYAGCGMPFYLSGQVRDFDHLFATSYGVLRNEEFFQREKGIKVLTGTEAVVIDRAKKEVAVLELDTGRRYAVPYDKLVLATGSEPITPPIEGLDLKGVHRLNHPDDALAIKELLDTGEIGEAAVIGAGLIGLESLDALLEKRVFAAVVEFKDQILPGILDSDTAAVVTARLEEQGAEFYLGEKVLRLEGDESGKVTKVVTDQRELTTDMVVVAVGVRPNAALAREAGLEIGATGAITINEYCQTNDPDIFALGDCVENLHLVSGRKVFVPLASTANRQGRVVGDNITGLQTKFRGILGTAVLHVRGINVARTGLGEQAARDLGYNVITSVNATHDMTHYHPSSKKVIIKLVVDGATGRVLGAQGIGPGDVVKRVDVLATAITYGATVDQLHDLDLGYAPPFSTPIDAAAHAANIIRNKQEGLAVGIGPAELQARLATDDDFVLLDVRTPQQFQFRHIEDPRVMLVTLGDIRERIEEIPRDKEIITICVFGVRSYEALRILKGADFKDVKFLEGGLEFWPYEIE